MEECCSKFLTCKMVNIILIKTVLRLKTYIAGPLKSHKKIKRRAESNKPIMETKWNTK